MRRFKPIKSKEATGRTKELCDDIEATWGHRGLVASYDDSVDWPAEYRPSGGHGAARGA